MTLGDPALPPKAGAAHGRRRRLDPVAAGLARMLVRVFFRRVELVGGSRLPAAGPLLLVANHNNGMIDPLLILAALPAGTAMPRFLGAHVLWRNPVLRPWLELGGVIPIYRPKDAGTVPSPAQNLGSFARCHEELAAGGRVALFPEGVSHSEPGLAPLKTGAARIVLEAAQRFPGLAPLIVPVGLTFESKGTFRSRALVEIGQPIDPTPEIEEAKAAGKAAAQTNAAGQAAAQGVAAGRAVAQTNAAGQAAAQDVAAAASVPPSPAAVRELTARIDGGLRAVTLSFGSWDEARRLGRAAELFSRELDGAGGLPDETLLQARFRAERAFIDGYAVLRRQAPEPTAAAAAAVGDYDRMLNALGLRDDQVAATYPVAPAARWLGATLLRLLIELPVATAGTLLNWLPYRVVGQVAARATGEPDMPASFKIFGGIVLFPLAWCLEALLAARLAGPPASNRWLAAVLTAAAGPFFGWTALRFNDRRERLWREARAWILLRSRRALAAELRRRRQAALLAVRRLVTLYEEAGP